LPVTRSVRVHSWSGPTGVQLPSVPAQSSETAWNWPSAPRLRTIAVLGQLAAATDTATGYCEEASVRVATATSVRRLACASVGVSRSARDVS
jgi:hypothetical protein